MPTLSLPSVQVVLGTHAQLLSMRLVAGGWAFTAELISEIYHNEPQFIIQAFIRKLQAFNIQQSFNTDSSDGFSQCDSCLGGRWNPCPSYSTIFLEFSPFLVFHTTD